MRRCYFHRVLVCFLLLVGVGAVIVALLVGVGAVVVVAIAAVLAVVFARCLLFCLLFGYSPNALQFDFYSPCGSFKFPTRFLCLTP